MTERLAVLLLPCRLEDYALAAHARDLLAIPRVIAVEGSPRRPPGPIMEMVAMRAARRLRFPGEPRLFVLYHPSQYPLARALGARYADSELWYVRTETNAGAVSRRWREHELAEYDGLAAERAARTIVLSASGDPRAENQELRERLVALEVITARGFAPGARIDRG